MMKKILIAAAVLLGGFAVSAATAGAADDVRSLAKRQNVLNAEYALAKDSSFYFVLDVAGRKLELRVRGMVLRSWPLGAMKFWGRPDFAGTVELVKKSALKAPQRIVIKPGEGEGQAAAPAEAETAKPAAAANPAEFDLEALELKDMPGGFELDFDNGLHITVKSRSGRSGGLLNMLGRIWKWNVGLPLRHAFGSAQAKKAADLELLFDDEKDAQAIYWHFFDGIKGIIL